MNPEAIAGYDASRFDHRRALVRLRDLIAEGAPAHVIVNIRANWWRWVELTSEPPETYLALLAEQRAALSGEPGRTSAPANRAARRAARRGRHL